MTRPWPVGFVGMNFHKEMEGSEASRVFISRRRGRVNRLTWADSEKELNFCGSLNHLYGAFLLGFVCQSSRLPGSESIFGLSQGPPLCARVSLSQDGF